MTTPATALEAALREAIARHLHNIELAADYPPIPAWLREFDRLAEAEAAFPDTTHLNPEPINV